MKKLNAANAIAVLSLGLILSVVVVGCGGNDSAELAVTKNAKAGSSDSGAGGGTTKPDTKTGSSDSGAGGGTTKPDTKTGSSDSGAGGGATTSDTKTGIADGGTGESVTVSDSELEGDQSTCYALYGRFDQDCTTLTKVQMNALTSAQWEEVDGILTASQVASIPTKTIKNLTTVALEGLSAAGTQALTTEQLKVMSKDQLNALVSSGELTETQLETVNKKLKQLG